MTLDPKLPDWMKDRLKGSMERYGHRGSMEMMITVTKIVAAKEVDDGLRSKVAAHPIELEHEMQHAIIAEAPERKP